MPAAAQACGAPAVYHRRRPERTLPYRLVQTHLATWLALREEEGDGVRTLTEREFRRYLTCGILAHGFARARCPDCGHDFLVAYSCKGRGVCPACTTRRMVETAAHLVDHVIPRLPVRQWVLSLPKRLRYHLDDAKLQNAVLHSLLHGIEQGLRQSLAESGEGSRIGAVVFIHRFGGLLNAHLHFHVVMIDGVFYGDDADTLRFQETRLTPEQMAALHKVIRQRIVRHFVRRGLLDKADGEAMRHGRSRLPRQMPWRKKRPSPGLRAMPGRCSLPASTKRSRFSARSAAAQCGSLPSSTQAKRSGRFSATPGRTGRSTAPRPGQRPAAVGSGRGGRRRSAGAALPEIEFDQRIAW